MVAYLFVNEKDINQKIQIQKAKSISQHKSTRPLTIWHGTDTSIKGGVVK